MNVIPLALLFELSGVTITARWSSFLGYVGKGLTAVVVWHLVNARVPLYVDLHWLAEAKPHEVGLCIR